MLQCPVCHGPFSLVAKSYRCAQGHNFDCSIDGYVNLLLGKQQGGDDKVMLQARRAFLEQGFYRPLVEQVALLIEQYLPQQDCTILDLGCGEGRYMRALQALRSERDDCFLVTDLAKDAVRMAAKSSKKSGTFFVANAYALPLQDDSCDVIISIFSPYSNAEVMRCLKPGAIFIVVGPGLEHLYRFIAMIRDVPHQHKITPREEQCSGLVLLQQTTLQLALSLTKHEDIRNLFLMTPYYRQANQEKQAAILGLSDLDIVADFRLAVFKKESSVD